MKKMVMVAIIISVANKTYSQVDKDLFSFNYTLMPIGNDGVDFYKTDFNANIPIKLKSGSLTNNVGLDYYQMNYNNAYSFSTEGLTKFYSINYGLSYTYPWSDKWSINSQLQASIVSSLANTVDFDDLFLSGELSVTKKTKEKDKFASLTFGVNYSAITGKPRILPTISYTKSVNDKFSYGIGFPKAYAEYQINDINSLNAFLLADGFYANLNNPIFVNTTNEARKASFSSTSLGVEYNYTMDDFWIISFKTGYSLYNDLTLINSDGTEVFDFDTHAKPFFSTGIKFNLKSKHKK